MSMLERGRSEESKRILPLKRKPLKAKNRDLNLTLNVGKKTVVTSSTPLSQRGAFYCDSCEVMIRDSMTYLDHINGKKHQQLLGMHMRAERSSVSDVKAKLAKLAEATDGKEGDAQKEDILVRMERARVEEQREKTDKKKRRHPRGKGQ